MAYTLSFGPDFFREVTGGFANHSLASRPTSVTQALACLSFETWSRLAREIFRCEPKFLDIETVLKQVESTNTCLNLDSPVEVAIDAGCEFTVRVYDHDNP